MIADKRNSLPGQSTDKQNVCLSLMMKTQLGAPFSVRGAPHFATSWHIPLTFLDLNVRQTYKSRHNSVGNQRISQSGDQRFLRSFGALTPIMPLAPSLQAAPPSTRAGFPSGTTSQRASHQGFRAMFVACFLYDLANQAWSCPCLQSQKYT